jgi:hypothetical protein
MRITHTIKVALVLALAAFLLLGCGRSNATPEADSPEQDAGSDEFPLRDANEPLTVGEQATIVLSNDQAAEIRVLREDGETLYKLPIKQSTVIDAEVPFTLQTIEGALSEELAAKYVPVGTLAMELHAVQDTGYGFALKPLLTIHYTDAELDQAREQGATLDPLKGNLIALYKEQRAPKWVPQTSVTVNEDERTVVVSNIAGSGAWRLVAVK